MIPAGARVRLETERMVLRQFTSSDADLVVDLDSDPEVMRYVTGGSGTSREEVVSEYLPAWRRYDEATPGYGFWAAHDRDTGEFLGWFHLRAAPGHPPDEPELGYRLRRAAWGRGLATEGSVALVDSAFGDLGASRVLAETMVVNTASRRVMEKAGLAVARYFVADWPHRIPGDEHGDVEYALDRATWERRRGVLRVGHADGRTAFLAALDGFVSAAGGLDDGQLLAASRCRGWTVGDVVVHVHLGLQEVLLALVSGTADGPDVDAASYWTAFAATADDDPVPGTRFVRALGAAYRRPGGAVEHLRPTARALAQVVSVGADVPVAFQGHVLSAGDFLTTWAVELAVHHLDLARELELPPPAAPALHLARRTVEALARGSLPAGWSDEAVVLLGTGRVTATDAQREDPVAARLPVLG